MAEQEQELESTKDQRVYKCDGYGIFHTDEIGNKIYDIRGKEFIVVGGKLASIDRTDGRITVTPDTSDNENLNLLVKGLGKPLRSALSWLYIYRPNNPIEFLVERLLNYRLNELQDLL